jgi:hypothetical protein
MHRFEAAKKTNLDEIKNGGGGGRKKISQITSDDIGIPLVINSLFILFSFLPRIEISIHI